MPALKWPRTWPPFRVFACIVLGLILMAGLVQPVSGEESAPPTTPGPGCAATHRVRVNDTDQMSAPGQFPSDRKPNDSSPHHEGVCLEFVFAHQATIIRDETDIIRDETEQLKLATSVVSLSSKGRTRTCHLGKPETLKPRASNPAKFV